MVWEPFAAKVLVTKGLNLVPQKTRQIWLASRQQLEKLDKVDIQFLCESVATVNPAQPWRHYYQSTNHGRSYLCRLSCLLLPAALTVDGSAVTSWATKSLVHAFISCRLAYCNALLYVIADCQLQWLESVQNVPVRLITGLHRKSMMPSSSLCNGYRFGKGRHTSWRIWCTIVLMAVLQSAWQSSVIQ